MRTKGLRYYKEFVMSFPTQPFSVVKKDGLPGVICIYWKQDIRDSRWYRYFNGQWEGAEQTCRVTGQNGSPDINRLIPVSKSELLLELL